MRRTGPVLITLVVIAAIGSLAIAEDAKKPTLKSEHGVKIDPAKPHPGIVYSDILRSLQDQVAWEKGQIRMFDKVRMTFLPPFKDPSDSFAYNPFTGARIATQIIDGNKKVVDTVFWKCAEEKFPYWNCNAVGNSEPITLASGGYTYRWLLEGQAFWEIAFDVTAASAKSAYQQPKVFFDGPWDKHAYVYVPNGNLDSSPTFNLFFRDKSSKPGSWVRSPIEVEIRRGKTLVASHPGSGKSVHMMRPWWQKLDLSLHSPGNKSTFTASELVKKGTYTITVKVGGKKLATYRYKASGKGLPVGGLQKRGKTKPMQYLEGAEDRFYIEKIK